MTIGLSSFVYIYLFYHPYIMKNIFIINTNDLIYCQSPL